MKRILLLLALLMPMALQSADVYFTTNNTTGQPIMPKGHLTVNDSTRRLRVDIGTNISVTGSTTVTAVGVTNVSGSTLNVNVTNTTLSVTQEAIGVTNLTGSTLSVNATNAVVTGTVGVTNTAANPLWTTNSIGDTYSYNITNGGSSIVIVGPTNSLTSTNLFTMLCTNQAVNGNSTSYCVTNALHHGFQVIASGSATGSVYIQASLDATNYTDALTWTFSGADTNIIQGLDGIYMYFRSAVSNYVAGAFSVVYYGGSTPSLESTYNSTIGVSPVGVTNYAAPLAIVGTNNVGGFTLVTNLDFKLDYDVAGTPSGDVLVAEIQVQNAVRTSGGTGILQSLMVVNSTNASPTFDLLVCDNAITWPATNAVANLVFTELETNLVSVVKSSDGTWVTMGTNNIWFYRNIGLPIRCDATTLYLYPINKAAITNSELGAQINLGIYQD